VGEDPGRHPADFQANKALSDIYRRLGDLNLVASDQAIERALSGAGLGTRNRAELSRRVLATASDAGRNGGMRASRRCGCE
jgi:hypothetical protein